MYLFSYILVKNNGPSVKVCFNCGEIRLSDSEVRK